MADNKMLIDATHPEETRVVVLRGGRVEEFDYESAARKLLRGNIYLAKVTRVEPALQAAFIDYGGNRHGFLAFNEIHPDYYQIPMADRLELIEAEAAAAVEANDDDDDDGDEDAHADSQNHGDEAASPNDGSNEPDAPDDDGEVSAQSETAPDEPDAESEQSKNISVAATADPKLSEEPPETSDAHTEPRSDQEQNEDGNDESAAAEDDNNDESPTIETSDVQNSPAPESDASPATTDEPDDPDNSDGDDAPHPIGLVEDDHVEDVDDHNETSDEAPIEQVGSEDALEEVPSRPRRSRRSYKIQEVIKRRQILLVQVVKEERGNKGAALTTYLSLAGRYTVLMPNTARGGGVSRKISSPQDRKRMKAIASELDVPEGMGLIIRTAGASRTKQEIRRDFEYLLRLWESVRELTLESTAPSLVYEEGDLIKRSIRDLYNKDVDEIVVAGENAYKEAKGFMRMLMPSHTRNVTNYKSPEPLFTKFQIERQLNAMFSPQVSLKSGGYLVINQTEALVAVDVNSGRSTREFSIEETALHTNLEAADEVARQLKLRDLAGLIVIDFIDMDDRRNNRAVERRMKDALRNDRARIQVGRISHFGLMEMSRQRMRTGVLEGSTSQCAHCQGTGIVRSTESVALAVLRGLEDAVLLGSRSPLIASTTSEVALYILNSKREFVDNMEARLGQHISIEISDKMVGANFKVEKGAVTSRTPASRSRKSAVKMDWGFDEGTDSQSTPAPQSSRDTESESATPEDAQPRRRRRRRRERRPNDEALANGQLPASTDIASNDNISSADINEGDDDAQLGASQSSGEPNNQENTPEDDQPRRSRRRGRRGGRRNRERRESKSANSIPISENADGADQGSAQSSFESSNDAGASETGTETEGSTRPVPSDQSQDPDTPGMGPQPELTSSPEPDPQPASNADGNTEERPAKATRRRRTPTRPRRTSTRSKSAEDATPGEAPKSAEKSDTTPKPEEKPANTEKAKDSNSNSNDDEVPAYRRRAQKADSSEIEIKSVRVGAPDAQSSQTSPSETSPKKPTRTGWWQKRILGED